jgi:glyoxylase-like metal-dependent hydrolase (beta-lactamase superfamily II)
VVAVFLASFPAGPWQANCYLAAVSAGAECVVIDPGVDALPGIEALLAEHRLSPVAVIATHGHIDHIAGAAPLADRHGVPLWLHPADRHLLTDPTAGLGEDSRLLLAQVLGGAALSEPADLRSLSDGLELSLAGLEFTAVHAPGHTGGCTLLRTPHPDHPDVTEIVFSGDVLFAGSIGRTDLPGGDPEVMRQTLAGPVLALPDSAAVLPGHGPQTLMARERTTNPYLQPAFLRI